MGELPGSRQRGRPMLLERDDEEKIAKQGRGHGVRTPSLARVQGGTAWEVEASTSIRRPV